jgi:hypothetical protein
MVYDELRTKMGSTFCLGKCLKLKHLKIYESFFFLRNLKLKFMNRFLFCRKMFDN